MNTILIIEDEAKLRSLLARIIRLEGFVVIEANDCKTGIKKLETSDIDLVVCDVKLPDGNGVELVKKIKDKFHFIEIILLTAYGNIPDAVQAIKNGAFDYITKGDDNIKLLPLLYRALEKVELARRVRQLEKRLETRHSFDNIIGKSKSIQLCLNLANKVALTDTTVLLTGETGTGKEVFAQAIHQASNRSGKNFIAINCSAFNKELLESELFGHKAGAFTGAVKDQKGVFEEANNGTIFLDEIGEMATPLQAKLLRTLETGEILRVGDSKSTRVNVRIIAATNRDLLKEIENGNFRSDLYYRISAFQIQLPPLRERIPDIQPLALFFVKLFADKTNKKVKSISPECIAMLELHPWHGNIRELKNVIERSVILCEGEIINPSDFPAEIQLDNNAIYTDPDGRQRFASFELANAEKLHIQKVLNYTNGNKTETARLLKIALTTLYRKLDEYKIQ